MMAGLGKALVSVFLKISLQTEAREEKKGKKREAQGHTSMVASRLVSVCGGMGVFRQPGRPCQEQWAGGWGTTKQRREVGMGKPRMSSLETLPEREEQEKT